MSDETIRDLLDKGPKVEPEALRLLETAAKQGNPWARDELGLIQSGQKASTYSVDLLEGMLSKNEPRIRDSCRTIKDHVRDLKEAMTEALGDVEDAMRRFSENARASIDTVRAKRMAISSELSQLTSDLRDLGSLLGGKDFGANMDRLERLVGLSERLSACAGDGWLDKALLALLEGK